MSVGALGQHVQDANMSQRIILSKVRSLQRFPIHLFKSLLNVAGFSCSEANTKRVELSCEDINSSLVHPNIPPADLSFLLLSFDRANTMLLHECLARGFPPLSTFYIQLGQIDRRQICRHDTSVSFSWNYQPTHRHLYCAYAHAIALELTNASREKN